MRNCYELRKFYIRFWVAGVVTLLLFVAADYFFLKGDWRQILVLTVCVAGFETIVFVVTRNEMTGTFREIRRVSDIMIGIVEQTGQIPEEEYKQGEIGYLYTNMYKLVSTLKESKLKEQEEKIFLRDMISDISHQLKTPLASLKVFVDLLYDGRVTEPDKQRQMLEESRNQITRMEWMALSMLKLARIEAGAIQFEKKECDLNTIFVQVEEGVAYLTKERNQTMHIECPENAMLICDGDWLVEGIINLVKNASDYSEKGTTISLTTEINPVYTRIFVEDEGMGIPEEELPHIFKRFYRVNKEVNPNSVGIGLSLTRSIVEGMGGKISVRSELGKYTRFILTFVHQ
ncbi:MAG: sensor histidine kinase [Wujia sp.]